MKIKIPSELSDLGFEQNWDLEKISALDLPITWVKIGDLIWHFDLPLLSENGPYNLKPRDLMDHPGEHQVEYYKTMQSESIHPVDVVDHNGRLVIIKGLYRLIKASINNETKVAVRIVPAQLLPTLKK